LYAPRHMAFLRLDDWLEASPSARLPIITSSQKNAIVPTVLK
jgi:hypothetical protein